MDLVFLMDPLETVDVAKDTSWAFMAAADRRGDRVWYVPNDGLSHDAGRLLMEAQRVTPRNDREAPFERHEWTRLAAEQTDAILIRTDPPFDAAYLLNTWLLDRAAEQTVVINEPRGLRNVSEKLWPTRFADLVPPTLVTNRRDLFADFLAEHGEVILKPIDGYGGMGVFFLRAGDTNAQVTFETLSGRRRRHVIVQRYVPASDVGDKRILLLDGAAIGAVLRVHGAGDHRNNFFAGGRAELTELTNADRRIVERVGPALREAGIHFAGIDVIGEQLIEVNVTSPTCVQEVERLYDADISGQVIEHVRRLAEGSGAPA